MEEAWTALCTTQSVGAALMKVAQTRQQVLDMMHSYIDRIGLDIKALDGKILHAAGVNRTNSSTLCCSAALLLIVSGTKGKGSTAAMCESILRHHGLKTGAFPPSNGLARHHLLLRAGLFISPHLVDVRERIRLNGELVSKEAYLDSFWRVWDAIEATKVWAHFNHGEVDRSCIFYVFLCVVLRWSLSGGPWLLSLPHAARNGCVHQRAWRFVCRLVQFGDA